MYIIKGSSLKKIMVIDVEQDYRKSDDLNFYDPSILGGSGGQYTDSDNRNNRNNRNIASIDSNNDIDDDIIDSKMSKMENYNNTKIMKNKERPRSNDCKKKC